jgi:hypothetical protein
MTMAWRAKTFVFPLLRKFLCKDTTDTTRNTGTRRTTRRVIPCTGTTVCTCSWYLYRYQDNFKKSTPRVLVRDTGTRRITLCASSKKLIRLFYIRVQIPGTTRTRVHCTSGVVFIFGECEILTVAEN